MFSRFLISGMVLLPVLNARKTPLILPLKKMGIVCISALMFIGYNWLYFKGTFEGYAGVGGVLVTTLSPIFTFGLVSFLSRKKLSALEIGGLILGLIGGLIILKIWEIDWEILLNSGNIFFLLGALSWAILTIFLAKGQKGSPPMTFIFWMYLISAFFLLPLNPIPEIIAFLNFDYIFWINFILISIGAMSFGTSIFLYTTAKLGPDKASVFIFTVPLSAIITSTLFLNEPFDIVIILGGILSLLAVYIINFNQ